MSARSRVRRPVRRPRVRMPAVSLPAVVVVAGIAFFNYMAWSLITPPFEGPDEYAHIAYAVDLAERGKAPTPSSAGGFTSSEHVFALDATDSFSTIRTPVSRPPWSDGARRAFERRVSREHPRRDNGGGGGITSATYGPIYYFFPAAGYLIAGGDFFTRVFAMRLASALFGALAVACIYGTVRELIPRPRWPAVAAGLLVAFQPMFAFMSGVVSADNGVNLAAAALIFLLVRALRRGLSPGLAAAIPAVFVLGVYAKTTMFALAPVLLLALALIAWRRAATARAWIAMAAAAAGVVAAWVLVAHLVGRPVTYLPTGGTAPAAKPTISQDLSYIWQIFLPPLPFMTDLYTGPGIVPAWTIYVKEAWGVFGWASLPFPEVVFKVIALLILSLALLAAIGLWRERTAVRRLLPELVVVGLSFVCVSAFIHLAYVRTSPFAGDIAEQGRYLFPAITAPAVLAIGACYGVGRRLAPVMGTVLVSSMMLLGMAAQLFVLQGYFT